MATDGWLCISFKISYFIVLAALITTAVMKNSENSINKPIDKTGGITGQNNPMLNENLSPYSYFYKNAKSYSWIDRN